MKCLDAEQNTLIQDQQTKINSRTVDVILITIQMNDWFCCVTRLLRSTLWTFRRRVYAIGRNFVRTCSLRTITQTVFMIGCVLCIIMPFSPPLYLHAVQLSDEIGHRRFRIRTRID